MRLEEHDLSESLHRLVPDPPRALTVEDVARRVADGETEPTGHPRRWFPPLLVAATVIVVVAVAVSIITVVRTAGGNHAEGNGPTTAPHRTPSTAATSGRRTQPSRQTEPLVGPWHARLVRRIGIVQGGLASNGRSLFAQLGGQLVRIVPATGRVVADTPVDPNTRETFVVAAQQVWLIRQETSGRLYLDRFTLDTLRKVGSTPIGVAPTGGLLSVTAEGGRIYAVAGQDVVVIDSRTGAVLRRIAISGGTPYVVAVSPDQSVMYVAVSTPAGDALQERALPSNRLITSGETVSVISLVATKGGVFVQSSGGMQISVWFQPAHRGASEPTAPEGMGGGGLDVPVTVGHGSVWVGGPGTISCVDPATGKQRAHASVSHVNGSEGYLGSVVFAGGSAYANYQGGRVTGLVRLQPPGACFP